MKHNSSREFLVAQQLYMSCHVGGVVWRAGVRSGAVAGWSDGMAAAAGTDRAPAAGYSAGDWCSHYSWLHSAFCFTVSGHCSSFLVLAINGSISLSNQHKLELWIKLTWHVDCRQTVGQPRIVEWYSWFLVVKSLYEVFLTPVPGKNFRPFLGVFYSALWRRMKVEYWWHHWWTAKVREVLFPHNNALPKLRCFIFPI